MLTGQAKRERMQKQLYTIWDRGSRAFKIGISKNPYARLQELQTGNPHKLEMGEVIPNATVEMEKAQHRQFRSSRLNGEWFRYFQDGDELLVEGKAGNIACLIVSIGRDDQVTWTKKFNLSPGEANRCIVELDADGQWIPE